MRCTKCKDKVLQKSDTGTKVRIKGAITVQNGLVKSQCYWCDADVEFPVSALEAPTSGERFVLTK